MGNTYVNNTIELLDAITAEKSDVDPKLQKSVESVKCSKCFNYIAMIGGEYCSVTSPKYGQPRKLIRNTEQSISSLPRQTSLKSRYLSLPAPIMIEESYSSASSLDLGIATIELLPDHPPRIGTQNSSCETVDINTSIASFESENEKEKDFKLSVQNDIIQRNALYIGNENDKFEYFDLSDRDKSSVDSFGLNNGTYHSEGVESESDLMINLGIELKNKPNIQLNKRRQNRRKRKRDKRIKVSKVPLY